MAVPAGLEAAPPAARPFCAAAAPTGSEGVCGAGLAGRFCVSVWAGCACGLELEPAGDAWAAPAGSIESGGSGVSAGTGCNGPCDGSTVTPFVCGPLAAGVDNRCAWASLPAVAGAAGCAFEVAVAGAVCDCACTSSGAPQSAKTNADATICLIFMGGTSKNFLSRFQFESRMASGETSPAAFFFSAIGALMTGALTVIEGAVICTAWAVGVQRCN